MTAVPRKASLSDPPSAPNEPSLRERVARFSTLGRRALAYWKMSFALLVLGAALALVVAWNMKRYYKSECTVLYKPAFRAEDGEVSPEGRASRVIPKLKDMLTMRSRLETVIKEFHLYPEIVESKGMLDAAEEMQKHVGFRGRDNDIFVISFEGETQDETQKVTQRLADSMIEDFSKSSVMSSQQQVKFLATEEQHAEDDLEEANKRLAVFLTAHPEFAADSRESPFGGGAVGTNTKTGGPIMPALAAGGTADVQLGALYRQRARIEAEMKEGAIPSGAVSPQPDGVGALVKARDEAAKRAADAQGDLADKRTRYTDQHPDVIAARARADAAGRELHVAEVQLAAAQAAAAGNGAASGTAINADLQKKLDTVNAQIAVRQTEIIHHSNAAETDAGVSPPINDLVALETDWQRLLRAGSEARTRHSDLKTKLDHANVSAAEAASGERMEILDAAYRPSHPSRGGRTNAALAGGAAALMLAFAYAFGRVLMNDTIIDAADIEALRLIPVIGVVPKLSRGSATDNRGGKGVAGGG